MTRSEEGSSVELEVLFQERRDVEETVIVLVSGPVVHWVLAFVTGSNEGVSQ